MSSVRGNIDWDRLAANGRAARREQLRKQALTEHPGADEHQIEAYIRRELYKQRAAGGANAQAKRRREINGARDILAARDELIGELRTITAQLNDISRRLDELGREAAA